MRAQPGPATPECADAETLAAYSDRSLAAAERERLETHFADCMRCQLVLADIARADESALDARPAAEVPWYRRWRVAIPALAAVGAILVFIAIRRPANEEPQNDQLVAMAKREAPAVEPAAPEPAAAPEMPGAASAPAPAAPAPAPAPPASNEIAMDEAQAPAAAAPRARTMGAFSSQTLHRQATAPAMSALAGAPGAGAGAAIGGEMLVTIFPPDRSVMWIIGKNGMVQRRDADGTMRVQQSGVSTDLVAGASPSATVCWVVGRSGTIIRTTDGEHWAAVASPTTETLVAVSSESAGDATVTTASSKSFVTSDGGATWHQQ
jgi:hypothetical protein